MGRPCCSPACAASGCSTPVLPDRPATPGRGLGARPTNSAFTLDRSAGDLGSYGLRMVDLDAMALMTRAATNG